MPITRRYRTPALTEQKLQALVAAANAQSGGGVKIQTVESEFCFYLENPVGASLEGLTWLLSETFEPESYGESSFLKESTPGSVVVEVGPRLSFTSAFSTNAVSIFKSCGVAVERVERYRRYLLVGEGGAPPDPAVVSAFAASVHDRMTEWRLRAPLTTFTSGATPTPVATIPLLAQGAAALEKANVEQGLSLDTADIAYLMKIFTAMGRDPTDVELFDFSQSNSEHSRHWFFRGQLVLDGVPVSGTLMDVVRETLEARPNNSVVAFADNSSAITGFTTPLLLPTSIPGAGPTPFALLPRLRHLLLTAETHNFPTGIAPFPGAETGTGGRLRDSHATGRGSYPIAGTTGYCVGALDIPGHPLPWESPQEGGLAGSPYPGGMARPLDIEIQASNGASDYGNKFGEPVTVGFTRSVGLVLPGGERREYIKPIMFTAGIGALDEVAKVKGEAGAGMVVVKLGGPAYRIGMGGSAASSMMGGDNKEDLDFNAVQRGDAEMEHKVNRVIRACAEMGEGNPIVAIHDQGAGGNCNVLKEILAPAGGRIDIRAVLSGDTTLSVLELWGAEYQEADALLLHPHAVPLFSALCTRECVPVAYVGRVDGSGRVVVFDSSATPGTPAATPVDLDLEAVLGKMPQKTFASTRTPPVATPFTLPPGATIPASLDRVLTLLAVGSKRFLTNKVDRSVTGLVAQQQCVGPLHTPLADATVLALSHFDTVGIASSIGEQPVKGLTGAHAAHGRLAVAEAILNLGCVGISSLGDAKCSANWMWAAKLPGEGAALYDTARAMADFMIATGVAVDGGKDSLSMAAKVPGAGGGSGGSGGSAGAGAEGGMVTVKAPGTLVISLYAPCPDIRRVLTPDLKLPGSSSLLLLSLAPPATSPCRLGGSALAQVYGQVGAAHEVPDCTNPPALVALFNAVQGLIRDNGGVKGGGKGGSSSPRVLSYHDISDGGLVVTLLEMAFAGDCGLHLDLTPLEPTSAAGATTAGGAPVSPHALLFNEELGVVLEVEEESAGGVSGATALAAQLAALGVHATPLGVTTVEKAITLHSATHGVLLGPALSMTTLRDTWESTSFALEARQCNPLCSAQEAAGLKHRGRPAYRAPHTPTPTPPLLLSRPPAAKPRVAVVRAEGCNGDREMTAALWGAGLDVWDVHISDLARGVGPPLESFRGCVFPGGFSYADVLDSAKGWAGVIKFNPTLAAAFSAFYARPDTFSLGVCNGAQLSTLLGWAPFGPDAHAPHLQPRFTHNASGRFESRWATVRVRDTPSVLLKGMAGSVLGVWVSHGEGRAHFPDPALLERAWQEGCVPLVYTEEGGEVGTEVYPANPNGSPRGIAGLCSKDGRHLAVMPHPERAVYSWQWPWMPQEWRDKAREGGGEWGVASHWHKMFTNARAFLEGGEE